MHLPSCLVQNWLSDNTICLLKEFGLATGEIEPEFSNLDREILMHVCICFGARLEVIMQAGGEYIE